MSESIFEEADLILNGRIADGEVKSFKVTGTTYCKITNALKQAKKQEKLLGLYREKEKHEQEFPALNNLEYEDYQRIKTKIRELEYEK